jgi:hypothetical protein
MSSVQQRPASVEDRLQQRIDNSVRADHAATAEQTTQHAVDVPSATGRPT